MLELISESPYLYAFTVLAVFCAASFQSMFGIGLSLIVSPFLLMLDPRLMPATPLCLGALSALPHACSNLGGLNLRHCAWATAGRALGVGAGTWLFVNFFSDTGGRAFALLFAATLLVALVLSSFGRWAKFFSPSVPKLSCASAIGGVMGTVTSIGGPPVALIYRLEAPAVGRLHLNFLLGTGALMSLIALAAAGQVSRMQMEAAASYLVPVAAGLVFAHHHAGRAGRHFRQAVLLAILVSAVVIVARNL